MTSLLSLYAVPAIDTSLDAPMLTLLSAQDEYPPRFSHIFPVSLLSTDTVRLQCATDEAFTSLVFNSTDLIGEYPDPPVFAGRTSVLSGEHFFRERVERGTAVSAWTSKIKHGDTTAPTFTSADSSTQIEETPVSGTITTNETCTFDIGGTDASYVDLDTVTGEWSLKVTPDYDLGKRSYTWEFTAIDLAGNRAFQTYTHIVTNDPSDDAAPAWSTRTDSKSTYITLSGSDLTATLAVGAPNALVKSNGGKLTSATSMFSATVDFNGQSTYFGFCYDSAPLNDIPGVSTIPGIAFHIAPGGWEFYVNGVNLENDYAGGYTDGTTVSIERVGMTFRAKVNGSYVGSAHTINAGVGDLFAFFASADAAACTADFTGY